jgi:hypothetical protein
MDRIQEQPMIPASHFIWVIQAEREEQMRRSQWLVAARFARDPRPSLAARMIASLRARRARGAAAAGHPTPVASGAAVCC